MSFKVSLSTMIISLLPLLLLIIPADCFTRPHADLQSRHSAPTKAMMLPHLPNLHQSSNILQVYSTTLRRFPLTTKSITAATLSFVGDAVAQAKSKKYDILRGLTFLGFGALYTGAFQHFWFDILNSNIVDWGENLHLWGPSHVDLPLEQVEWYQYFDIVRQLEHPPSPAKLAAAKVAVNQFLMVPFVYMPLFFWATSRFDVEAAKARAAELYTAILARNYVYWLPVQFAQFFLLPPDWQIPFLSAASLVWTVILSTINNPKQADEQLATDVVLEDMVTLDDVRAALVSEPVNDLLSNEQAGTAATGLLLGLLTSAADDAALAELFSEPGMGVALLAFIGTAAGFLAGKKENEENDSNELE